MLRVQTGTSQDWFLFNDRNLNDPQDLDSNGPNNLIKKKIQRSADYCNLPMARFTEGEKTVGNGLELSNLVIFIRHGQRSSAHVMMNTNYEYYINCSIKQFPAFLRSDWKEFLNTLDKTEDILMTREKNGKCTESQLTLLGILQFFIIGSRLQNAYRDFIQNNLITITSTPYQRSILSAEILRFFIRDSNSNSPKTSIVKSENLVFCRSTNKISCQCDSLMYYYAKYNRIQNIFEKYNPFCLKLVNSFNKFFQSAAITTKSELNAEIEEQSKLSISALFDIISSGFCASDLGEISKQNHFCWPQVGQTINQKAWKFLYNPDGTNKYTDKARQILKSEDMETESLKNNVKNCLPLSKIQQLWHCFDMRNEEISKNVYFIKYSKLASYPILIQLIDNIRNDAAETEYKSINPNHIFVGHDQTLRYLLASLDLKKKVDPELANTIRKANFDWPGFGDRLVIEVYKNRQESMNNSRYFRILYNGLDFTSALQFCPSKNESNSCNLDLFWNYLHDNNGYWSLFQSNKYENECQQTL